MLGTSLLWRSTVAFTYLKVKSAQCQGRRQGFRPGWPDFFHGGRLPTLPPPCRRPCPMLLFTAGGLSLGLKNLVLFTSLCVVSLLWIGYPVTWILHANTTYYTYPVPHAASRISLQLFLLSSSTIHCRYWLVRVCWHPMYASQTRAALPSAYWSGIPSAATPRERVR